MNSIGNLSITGLPLFLEAMFSIWKLLTLFMSFRWFVLISKEIICKKQNFRREQTQITNQEMIILAFFYRFEIFSVVS